MNLTLHVHPGAVWSWEEFGKSHSTHYSAVALDGMVSGPTRFEYSALARGWTMNFNHHEGVDRLSTRATCEQILLYARMGLFAALGGQAHVYVNACDEDVALSVFLLRNPAISTQPHNPALNRLVGITGLLDCTGGAYPFNPSLETVAEQAWVFEPYRLSRSSRPNATTQDADVMRSIIQDVEHRIMLHLLGKGERAVLRTGYRATGGGRGWLMVTDEEAHARLGIFNTVDAYVSWQDLGGGWYRYTLARKSPLIPFPMGEMFKELNSVEAEKRGEGFAEAWGGSEIIGGSPRARGSLLAPEKVQEVIAKVIGEEQGA